MTRVLSRFIFILVITLIIANAHGPFDGLMYRMHSVGLDVPMTPFTTDMTLMLSKDGGDAYYKKNFYIRYQTAKGYKNILAEDLGWYEFKAPFQWMSECRENSSDCPFPLYYLCRSLEDYTKSIIISWSAMEMNSINNDANAGFGVEYRCPVK